MRIIFGYGCKAHVEDLAWERPVGGGGEGGGFQNIPVGCALTYKKGGVLGAGTARKRGVLSAGTA